MADALTPHRGAEFLAGGGEMGAIMHAHDWSTSPLGAPETWPQSLRSVVGLLLASKFPMFVAWGPELGFLYNDRYAEILGAKHPNALGKRFHDIWQEIWADISPLINAAMAGEATYRENLPLVVNRKGFDEQAWFTFSYSPVRDESGRAAGMFCTVAETTAQVLSERRQTFRLEFEERLRALSDPQEIMGAAADQLGTHLGVSCVGYAEIDLTGYLGVIERDWTAPGMRSVAGVHRIESFGAVLAAEFQAGRTVRIDDVRTDLLTARGSAGSFEAIDTRAFLAAPLVKDGRLTSVLFVLSRVPRAWRSDEAALVEEVAERTWAAVSRARAEAALRESEARLRAAIEASESGTFDWDIRTNALVWDEALDKLFGLPPGETARSLETFVAMVHPDDRAGVIAACAACAATGVDFSLEFRVVRPNGEVRWLYDRGKASPGADGRPATMTGACVDVTERRLAADALRESEARHRSLIETMEDGFCVIEMIFDGDGRPVDYRYLEMNPAFERQSGFGVAVGHTVPEAVPDLEAHWFEAFGRVALTGQPERIEDRSEATDRWYDVRATRVGDPQGRRVALLFTDVSDRRRAEQQLRELNETLESRVAEVAADLDRVWRNASDIFVVIDAEGLFKRVNPATMAILGWSEAELLGRSLFDFIHAEDLPLTFAALEHARGDVLPTVENRYRTKEGELRTIAWLAAPEGELIYAYGRDVSAEKARHAELQAAQEQLRQAQKMEAVGQLTGGIAHDFNNMLAVVIGSLDLLGRRLGPDDARARRYVDAAAEGARRAALLTQRLLAFSRQQPLRPEPIEVNRLVAGMSNLLRHSLGGAVHLETVLGGGLWPTHADPNQLENLILNLAVNARDAMPDGGRLTIETQNSHLDQRYVADELGVSAGQYVMIAVSDTGTGMPEEVIAKAFDPFFTTKEVGKGTGLGLSQVYGFVKQSGGHVKIYSEPGQGTTVKIYLPRHTGADAAEDPADRTGEVPGGDGREVVLVVEDEPAVRAFSVDALSELGYRVLEADGAAAGLRLLDAHPEIELLFTDVVMPEVSGRKLVDEARLRRPDLKVLFTTGYTRNAVVHNGVLDADVELIGKPFTVEELAAKVRGVLDSAPAGSRP